jgi:endonuclease/exonuclease/phosphatase family metal-dependent hydrolase
MRVRLLTYNIHKGIGGVDRRYRPERIIEAVAQCDPDIVLLQEVADGVPRWRHHRQVHLLGDALGFRYRAFQPNARLRKGHYGNAILSRFPLSDIHDIELTVPLKKRRRALGARCHVHSAQHSYTLLLWPPSNGRFRCVGFCPDMHCFMFATAPLSLLQEILTTCGKLWGSGY